MVLYGYCIYDRTNLGSGADKLMSVLDRKSDVHNWKFSEDSKKIYDNLINDCEPLIKREFNIRDKREVLDMCDKIHQIMDNNMSVRGANFYKKSPEFIFTPPENVGYSSPEPETDFFVEGFQLNAEGFFQFMEIFFNLFISGEISNISIGEYPEYKNLDIREIQQRQFPM